MKKGLIVFLLTLIISVTGSCKKKECPGPPEPTPTELLISNVWNWYKVETYDTNGNLVNTANVNFDMVFAANHHFYLYDNSGSLQNESTWSLNEDTDPMTLTIGNGIYRVKTLTSDELVFERNDNSGNTYVYSCNSTTN